MDHPASAGTTPPLAPVGVVLALLTLRAHIVDVASSGRTRSPRFVWVSGSPRFSLLFRGISICNGSSPGIRSLSQVLAFALALWAVLMGAGQFQNPWLEMFGSAADFSGPIPQMLLGIAMVMVLFENERNAVQENTLALSTLGVDPRRLLFADDLVPSMQAALDRLRAHLPIDRAAICHLASAGADCCPRCSRIFAGDSSTTLENTGAGDYICELAYRHGGSSPFTIWRDMAEPLPVASAGTFAEFKQILTEAGVRNLTAVNLQTREHNFGVILFPHAERKAFGSSGPRLMVGLALQIGSDARKLRGHARRPPAHAGIRTAHRNRAGHQFPPGSGRGSAHHPDRTGTDLQHQPLLHCVSGRRRDPLRTGSGRWSHSAEAHSRNCEMRFTEYVIRTGEPLLIRSDLEKRAQRLGITLRPEAPAKCLLRSADSSGQQGLRESWSP